MKLSVPLIMQALSVGRTAIWRARSAYLQGGWDFALHGSEIVVSNQVAERSDQSYQDVVLENRLRQALTVVSPALHPLSISWRKAGI